MEYKKLLMMAIAAKKGDYLPIRQPKSTLKLNLDFNKIDIGYGVSGFKMLKLNDNGSFVDLTKEEIDEYFN
jgi:hypothetical protein